MIQKAFIGLATAAIFSAVAAYQAPTTAQARSGNPEGRAHDAEIFPLLAKADRLGPPASKRSVTVGRRIGSNTTILIRIPASRLASR